MDGEFANDSPWNTYCWLRKHSTCCAYGLCLCVHMCTHQQHVCVSACTKDLFLQETVCVCCVSTMSYSFSLTHNNMCVCGWVYTDTFSSKTSKLCVQSDVNVCASHYFRSLLTKWNPVLAISPPQHPFTVPVLSTQY